LSQAGDPSGKIKVVDRRRFDDDGEPRSDWAPAGDSKPAGSPAPEAARPAEPEPPPQTRPPADSTTVRPPRDPASATSPLFLDLVNDLAQQAVLLMHGAEGLPAQPEHSRRLIDYLGELESKTRGNLSEEEAQALSNVLYQLRSAFVQRTT
jgi:hypothetical protein